MICMRKNIYINKTDKYTNTSLPYWRNAALCKRNELNSKQVAVGCELHVTAVIGNTMLGNEESRTIKRGKAQRGEEEGNSRAEKRLN